MALIPSNIIDEIRSNIEISDYISQYTSLRKSGRNMIGSCPFHEDRNPSMSIHQEKQIFNCFSCQRKGDIFKFIMEMDALSYPQAIQKAAEYADVKLHPQYIRSDDEKGQNRYEEAIYQIHELAMSFYAYNLTGTTNGQVGLAYLEKRHLSQEIVSRYRIGLAPKDSNLLLTYLRGKGFTDRDLIESGIFFQTDSGDLLDRFRDRLVFPLRDDKGHVIGFSGRVLSSDARTAKYLNSPETSIFHKNQLLFNFDQAKTVMRKNKEAIICEGFMDVLRLESIGVHYGVATMGTALSDDHLRQLSHLVESLIFIFDGDQAGQNATEKAYQYQGKYPSLTFKSIRIPNDQDPDEWISQAGKASFDTLLEHPDTYFDFQLEYLKSQFDLSKGQDLASYIEALLRSLTSISSSIERQIRLNQLSQMYGIDRHLLEEQFTRLSYQISQDQNIRQVGADDLFEAGALSVSDLTQDQVLPIRSTKAFQAEKLLIQLLIYHESAWRQMESQYADLVFFHDFAQALYFELESVYLEDRLSFPLNDLAYSLEGKVLQFYDEVLASRHIGEYHNQVLRDCVYRIEEAYLELELQEWTQKAKEAHESRHISDASEALNHIVRIKRKLSQLKHQLG